MNWKVKESKKAITQLKKVPKHIQAGYSYWRILVTNNGIDIFNKYKGFNFEKLKGNRQNQYSCRLSRAYRVIFTVESDIITINVIEVNKHEY